MRDYIRYEIDSEGRKYSSSIIVGVYLHPDEKGKMKEKKDALITCFLPKSQADLLIAEILKAIQEKNIFLNC